MFSKNLKNAIAAPIAFATAGATANKLRFIQEDLQDSEVMTLDLNFQFPRPREQISQDWLDSSHFMSAAKETKRKQNAIKKQNDANKNNVHLVHAVLKGESGRKLIKKMDKAKGVQTLLHLKLRINAPASQVR